MSIIITLSHVRGGRFAGNVRYASGARYPHHIRTMVDGMTKQMEAQLSSAMSGDQAPEAEAQVRDPGTVSSVRVVVPTPIEAPSQLVIGTDGVPKIVKPESPSTPQTAIIDKGGKVNKLDSGDTIKVTRFGEAPGGNGMPALPSTGMFTSEGNASFKNPGAPESPAKSVVPPSRKPVAPKPEAPAKSEGDMGAPAE